jgi:hypothetical protein
MLLVFDFFMGIKLNNPCNDETRQVRHHGSQQCAGRCDVVPPVKSSQRNEYDVATTLDHESVAVSPRLGGIA